MKVIDIIQQSQKTVFSFELLPPLKGQKADKLYRTIDELIEFNPQYINITTHRDEVEFRELSGGLMQKRIVRKRPGTVAIAAAIQNAYNIPVVPHIVCGGFTKEETENILLDLNFLGIMNVLALRGDGLRSESSFTPERDGHAHAKELVEQIVGLKQGKYLDPEIKNTAELDFCIGVAGYPEKHFEASNMDIDLINLKEKVDAGADYIVTQMFFDNQKYDIPEAFAREVRKCRTNDEARVVGTEWAIEQSRDLVAHHVPCLHIYTYGISDNTRQIAKAVI